MNIIKLYNVEYKCPKCFKRFFDVIDEYELYNNKEICSDCNTEMFLIDIKLEVKKNGKNNKF